MKAMGRSGWLRTEATAVAGLALAVLALHLATNGLYDFLHRSLYYMDSAWKARAVDSDLPSEITGRRFKTVGSRS